MKPGENQYKVHFGDDDSMSCEVFLQKVSGDSPLDTDAKEADEKKLESNASAREAKEYLESHEVLPLIQAVLQTVIKEKPKDPFLHIARHLMNGYRPSDAKTPLPTNMGEAKDVLKSADENHAAAPPKTDELPPAVAETPKDTTADTGTVEKESLGEEARAAEPAVDREAPESTDEAQLHGAQQVHEESETANAQEAVDEVQMKVEGTPDVDTEALSQEAPQKSSGEEIEITKESPTTGEHITECVDELDLASINHEPEKDGSYEMPDAPAATFDCPEGGEVPENPTSATESSKHTEEINVEGVETCPQVPGVTSEIQEVSETRETSFPHPETTEDPLEQDKVDVDSKSQEPRPETTDEVVAVSAAANVSDIEAVTTEVAIDEGSAVEPPTTVAGNAVVLEAVAPTLGSNDNLEADEAFVPEIAAQAAVDAAATEPAQGDNIVEAADLAEEAKTVDDVVEPMTVGEQPSGNECSQDGTAEVLHVDEKPLEPLYAEVDEANPDTAANPAASASEEVLVKEAEEALPLVERDEHVQEAIVEVVQAADHVAAAAVDEVVAQVAEVALEVGLTSSSHTSGNDAQHIDAQSTETASQEPRSEEIQETKATAPNDSAEACVQEVLPEAAFDVADEAQAVDLADKAERVEASVAGAEEIPATPEATSFAEVAGLIDTANGAMEPLADTQAVAEVAEAAPMSQKASAEDPEPDIVVAVVALSEAIESAGDLITNAAEGSANADATDQVGSDHAKQSEPELVEVVADSPNSQAQAEEPTAGEEGLTKTHNVSEVEEAEATIQQGISIVHSSTEEATDVVEAAQTYGEVKEEGIPDKPSAVACAEAAEEVQAVDTNTP